MNRNKVVVVAATEMELAQCRKAVGGCEFVVSGMGASNTAVATMMAIEKFRPKLVIQIGIAGAFDRSLQIGEVVSVTEDFQADLGAWREQQRRFEPFVTEKHRVDNLTSFRAVSAQSVNTACMPYLPESGAQIETMEGAAFFQAALSFEGVKAVQIRSISNYVDSPRTEWQIQLAISVLPGALALLLNTYN